MYQKSCDNGFGPAAVNLGNMYIEGFGVEKNLIKAE